MISVPEAERIIRETSPDFGTETVPLGEAAGRILATPVIADRDLPPYDRVAMDGVSVAHRSWDNGRRQFRIAGLSRAGAPPPKLTDDSTCIEVMTGAVLPPGSDCVIRKEDLRFSHNSVSIDNDVELRQRQNIHGKGKDETAGSVLLEPGVRLDPPRIAVLASVGAAEVLVGRCPRVAVVATGDELVDVSATPLPHQIRSSNAEALMAGLQRAGIAGVSVQRLPDIQEEMRQALRRILDGQDVVILSGGVSVGKFDYVPEILEALDVTLHFRKVAQRPGKPFCFGHRQADDTLVFALPGNPVSAVVGLHRYVLPQLWRGMGFDPPPEYVALSEDFSFSKALTYFLPVTITASSDARLCGTPVLLNGSGDFCGLARSDGFVELDAEPEQFPAGTTGPFYRWQI